jgi:hypothetical protein
MWRRAHRVRQRVRQPQLGPNNCGSCGTQCNLPNAVPACASRSCMIAACNAGFADCNQVVADGCEVSLSSPSNCGGCGNSCGAAACVSGTCTTCSPSAATKQAFDGSMTGCGAPGTPASIGYGTRASLCAASCHVCTAAEWMNHHGTIAPTSTYWTGDTALNFVGGSSNNCSVSTTAGSNVCTGGSMLVCPNGGHCQVTGCGLDATTPQFFGGCSTNVGPSSFGTAEGTLCCCP